MFHLDMEEGWQDVPATRGIRQKPLSGDFDETTGTGFRTRCIRIEPGGETFEAFEHAYWEEAFIIEGTLTRKADEVTVAAPAYVLRPPGTSHGPFMSVTGCVMLETQYFADRTPGETSYAEGVRNRDA